VEILLKLEHCYIDSVYLNKSDIDKTKCNKQEYKAGQTNQHLKQCSYRSYGNRAYDIAPPKSRSAVVSEWLNVVQRQLSTYYQFYLMARAVIFW